MDAYLRDLEEEEAEVANEMSEDEQPLLSKKPSSAEVAKVVLKKPAAAPKAPKAAKKAAKKAIAKPKMTLKRPAASTMEGEPLKRPAAATMEEENDGDEDSTGDTQLDVLRDRIKARKFEKLWDQMPEYVQRDFEEAKADKSGTGRARMTSIINRSVVRDGNKLVLAQFEDCAFFAEMVSRQKKRTLKKRKDGASFVLHLMSCHMSHNVIILLHLIVCKFLGHIYLGVYSNVWNERLAQCASIIHTCIMVYTSRHKDSLHHVV